MLEGGESILVSLMPQKASLGDPQRLLAYIGEACIFLYRKDMQTFIVHPSAIFVTDTSYSKLVHLQPPECEKGYLRLDTETLIPARIDVLQSWHKAISEPGLAQVKPTSLVYEQEGHLLYRKLTDGEKHTVWVEKSLMDVLHPHVDILLGMFRFELLKNGWIRVRFKEQGWQVVAIFTLDKR